MTEPSVTFLIERANAFLQAGRSADGMPFAEQALAADPENPAGHLVLGWLLLTTDQPQAALEHLKIAGASGPNEPSVYHGLAQAYGHLDDIPNARAAAARELVLAPQSAGAHLRSARYALAGKATKADKKWAYERITSALEIDPDNEIVLESAARVVWGLKRFDEVDGYIARGLAIAPESSSLRYLYGVRESMKAEKKSTVNAEIVQVQQMGQVLAGDPRHAAATDLLRLRVWNRVRTLTALPLVWTVFLAPSMMIMYRPASRYGMLWAPLIIVIALSIVAVVASLRVFRAAAPGYLRRQLRVAFRGWVLPVAIVGGVAVLCTAVAFATVTSPTLARWSIVTLSLGALCSGAAVVGQAVRLFTEGTPESTAAALSEQIRDATRSGLVNVLRVAAPVLVLSLVALNTSHPDAVAPLFIVIASWGAAALAPLGVLLTRAWRERRRQSASAVVVPRATAVIALVGIVVLGASVIGGVARIPILPNVRDTESAYELTRPPTRETDPECGGTTANRLACQMDNLQDRLTMTPIPLPSITVPNITIPDITVPDITVPE